MKFITIFLLCLLLSGCYTPDQRAVGHFRAQTGELIYIRPDGCILYINDEKQELVGLVSITKEIPLQIHVIAPDTSPFVGTRIVFSENKEEIYVDWQNAIRISSPKPKIFWKE